MKLAQTFISVNRHEDKKHLHLSTNNDEQIVLVVGSGGREHALGWKLSHSPRVEKVFHAPGNGGTDGNLEIGQNEISQLADFASKFGNRCLTVVGPEEPLSLGISDLFHSKGLRILAPTASAARLETSKAYSKEFMMTAGIPTPAAKIFSDYEKALDHIHANPGPIVIKADGIAAGKGVMVCDNTFEAQDAIERIMVRKEFGPAGNKVVIEEKLSGEEASFIGLCDGNTIVPFESSQDHKRAQDNDKGPNTGGMGAYSPARIITEELHEEIMKEVMVPAVRQMKSRGIPFVGFLYAGIMIDYKSGRPFVLEFNTRMGDPECQVILSRLDSDLFEYLDSASKGSLDKMPPLNWKSQTAVCVVMASKGYPASYKKGLAIRGLESKFDPGVKIFHAGTARSPSGQIVTAGGRVLGITSLGEDAREAIDRAYSAVKKISWGEKDEYYRTDIGNRALAI